ncbi:MAG: ABC transporter ATP-binding protein [Parvularculaceae bacterium]|nr:ABC transporter ATP-binding protein [Parvularculaceae bacterium]MCB1475316.1 ABC transporter ATP-binding protein [Rhodobiaceae bacterium]
MTQQPVLQLVDVRRTYVQGDTRLNVLQGVSLSLNAGEIVALVGPSGAGKSTLLHLSGLLERPDGGEVMIGGAKTSHMDDGAMTALRRRRIGFVYQFHHLLPEFTALENVMMAQMIAGLDKKEAKDRASQLLDFFGLAARAGHRPAELSGGEQQRVAIARAVANAPVLLLADEPTGNLDPTTAERVFSLFMKLVRGSGLAAIIATHNHEIAARMDRRVTVQDGTLVEY